MAVRGRNTYRQAQNAIEITIGDDALVTKVLRGLTPELQRDSIESALLIATRPMQEAAALAAPRGTGPEKKKRRSKGGQMVESSYGRLYQNITRRRMRNAGQPTIRIGSGKAFWGRFIEMGWNLTRARKGGGKQVLRAVPARKWFAPAIDKATPAFTSAFSTYLRVALIVAAGRISGQVGVSNATRIKPARDR